MQAAKSTEEFELIEEIIFKQTKNWHNIVQKNAVFQIMSSIPSSLDPSARADNGLSLRGATWDGSLDRDTLAGLDEDPSSADGAAEAVEAGAVGVIEKRESLVCRPELGDRNIRVHVVGDRDGAFVVVIGVDPHRSLDSEFAVEGVISSCDGCIARVCHDDCAGRSQKTNNGKEQKEIHV